MQFSEQVYINHVRDALWQRSAGATVMVGAGFSRNAEKSRPDAPAPPTWHGLAEKMYYRLYPDNKGEHGGSAIAASPDFS